MSTTLDEEIRLKKPSRMHFIFGEEYYLTRNYRMRLEKNLSNPEDELNRLVLSGKEISEAEIEEFGNLAPFLADHRLIIVEDSGWFNSQGKHEEIIRVLESLPETTYIIFTEKINYEKERKEANKCKNEEQKKKKLPEGRYDLYRWFLNQKRGVALVTECAKMNERDLKKWIVGYCGRFGKQITEKAANLLLERVGSDLTSLSAELDKLIGYIGEGQGIRPADVETIGSGVVISKIFDMVDAVSRGDKDTSLKLYRDLIYNREEPLGILYQLGKQFQKIGRMKHIDGSGMNETEIAKKLAVPSWKVRFYKGVARKFDIDKIDMLLAYRAELDEQIKTTDLNSQVAVEMFLIKALTN